MLRISSAFYALGIIGIGVQQCVLQDFVPVILPSYPSWLPLRGACALVFGSLLVLAGVAMLFRKTARPAAILLGAVLFAFLVLRHIPDQLAVAPLFLGAWTNAFKILTLSGGAFLVAGSISTSEPGGASFYFCSFGRFAFAVTCVVFGAEHFLYAPFVAQLVPAWIPLHLFWTYLCGAALIAAGIGLVTPFLPRLAAALLGSMIFIWLIVLHIPRAIADPHSGHGNEITSVFEALAFSGMAFVLALTPKSRALQEPAV